MFKIYTQSDYLNSILACLVVYCLLKEDWFGLTESKFKMIIIHNLFDLVVYNCMHRNISVFMPVPWWAV
jgi:hypothetical protein